jgi:uncharacterized protein (TIGR02594 family)
MNAPKWLHGAIDDLGVAEVPGPASHPRILDYIAEIGLDGEDGGVAWCSGAAKTWMREAGEDVSGVTGRARSWLEWGVPLDKPRLGCITVLWRGSQRGQLGHVGLWLQANTSECMLLGGNQGNAVSVAPYWRQRVLGYRWPK